MPYTSNVILEKAINVKRSYSLMQTKIILRCFKGFKALARMKVLLGEAQTNQDQTVDQKQDRQDLDDKLGSDFQKDNKPASWASGYLKAWGQEVWKFSTGYGGNS